MSAPTVRASAPNVRPHELPGGVVVEVAGVRLVSELNAHEHFRERQKRAKEQHLIVGSVLRTMAGEVPALPVVVCVTRIAPRALDVGDNLESSGKHVRDAIAAWLGVDDRDPRVTWHTAQEQGSYGVRVEVVPVRPWSTGEPSGRVVREGVVTTLELTLGPRARRELCRRLALSLSPEERAVLAREILADAAVPEEETVAVRVGPFVARIHPTATKASP